MGWWTQAAKGSATGAVMCVASLAMPIHAQALGGSKAQRAVIDPHTGVLRAPEHDDRSVDEAAPGEPTAASGRPRVTPRAGAAAAALRSLVPTTGQRLDHPSGAVGRIVDASVLQYTVVRVRSDGALDTQCVTGAERAEAWVADRAQPMAASGASNAR